MKRSNRAALGAALAVTAALSGAANAGSPSLADDAGASRDFVFTDFEGHLVLRFAGIGPEGLTDDQLEEVSNVQLSTMVHDRIRAEVVFDQEPVESPWAERTTARIERRLAAHADPAWSSVRVDCRTATCRLVFEHSNGARVADQVAVMDAVQAVVQSVLTNEPSAFEPGVMLAGHYKERERSYVEVFLTRRARRD